jgi:hypothetical protein
MIKICQTFDAEEQGPILNEIQGDISQQTEDFKKALEYAHFTLEQVKEA